MRILGFDDHTEMRAVCMYFTRLENRVQFWRDEWLLYWSGRDGAKRVKYARSDP
jgi:hypothetical protein